MGVVGALVIGRAARVGALRRAGCALTGALRKDKHTLQVSVLKEWRVVILPRSPLRAPLLLALSLVRRRYAVHSALYVVYGFLHVYNRLSNLFLVFIAAPICGDQQYCDDKAY